MDFRMLGTGVWPWLDRTCLPLLIAIQFALEGDGVDNLGEAEVDDTALKSGVRRYRGSKTMGASNLPLEHSDR
jgi:hypothetical protein